MGYVRHHAIVVTSWDFVLLERARVCAVELGMTVTEIKRSTVNSYCSFLIAPDGSKEGWDASDEGDQQRAAFVLWLDDQRYEDGSTSLDWVEVQYGDENNANRIIQSSKTGAV